MTDIIKVENLTTSYLDKVAIKDINLNIPKGVRCAIVGPNGAGKSTLLKSILGLVKYDNGNVEVFEKTIKEVSKNIAYVPQKGSVNWDFPISVFDVVLMGRYAYIPVGRRPSKKDKEIAMKSLKIMNMTEFKNRQISELSGGQKQRVFLARALCQQVDLYMLDEPFTGIDITTEKLIADKFFELQKLGKTVIAVHHNLNTVKDYFDYIVVLNEKVVYSGSIDNPELDKKLEIAFRG